MLADKYMPVNLDEPGARLHNLEPPVFTFDACMDESFCDQLRDQSTATNRLKVCAITCMCMFEPPDVMVVGWAMAALARQSKKTH